MMIQPAAFSAGIIAFSEQRFFHPFEIISRGLAGLVFVLYADSAIYPWLIRWLGYGLLAVSVGLLCTPPSLHRHFARWSAVQFKEWFRWCGLAFLPAAAFLLFVAWTSMTG
ncbi:hypothetical protein [Neiella marina]|nr:hypothetical protein [Neiella marina]